jgi:hypothetical protein
MEWASFFTGGPWLYETLTSSLQKNKKNKLYGKVEKLLKFSRNSMKILDNLS